MEAKMAGLKKASHCWWFDSHNSAKRSPWLQSTLSELEKKTKVILTLIEGDADSFAQRAEMYYKKRPELVTLIEDFYRSYRYLAEHHELLRSEAGPRRATLFKSDSSNQSSAQKTWDSTEVDDYPESELSEVDDPEPEDPHQCERSLNLEAKSPIHAKINVSESPAKNYTAKRIAQMENDHELGHQDEEITRSLPVSPLNCNETAPLHESDDYSKSDDLETKALFEKIVDDVAKLTAEVENLRMEKEALMAELEMKDEEKRQVIRELSLTVEILKEENVVLKRFIKDSKKCGGIFELKKLKDVFSGTRRLFGLSSRFQPSLVAL